jgi:hypothetical protein
MAIMDVLKGGGSQLVMEVYTTGPDGEDAVVKSLELPFTSESLNPTGEFINSNAITASRSRGVGDVGNRAADGSFEVEVNYQNLPWLIYAALGSHLVATGTDVILDSNNELPSYRFFVRHGPTGGKIVEFRDALINSLRLTWASNAIMTASVDIVGLVENLDSPTLPSPIDYGVGEATTNQNTLLFPKHFLKDTITGDTSIDACGLYYTEALTVELLQYALDLEFTIDNGIDVDAYALDSSGRLVAVPGELSISGSTSLLVSPDNANFYAHLKAADIGTRWEKLWLTIMKNPSAVPASILWHHLQLNNLYIVDISHDIADRGKVAYDIDFEAKHDPSKSPLDMPIFMDLDNSGNPEGTPPDYWPLPEDDVE